MSIIRGAHAPRAAISSPKRDRAHEAEVAVQDTQVHVGQEEPQPAAPVDEPQRGANGQRARAASDQSQQAHQHCAGPAAAATHHQAGRGRPVTTQRLGASIEPPHRAA
eukprot:9691586-Alexandrium_andersonii.AAC.1